MSWLQRIKARKAEEAAPAPEAPAADEPEEEAEEAGEDAAGQDADNDEPAAAPAEPDEDTAVSTDGDEPADEPANESADKQGADNAAEPAQDPEPAAATALAAGSHELFVCLTGKFGAEFAVHATEQGMDYAQALEARVASLEQQNRELSARLENRAGMGEDDPATAEEATAENPRITELRKQGLSKGEAAYAAKLNVKK